MSADASPLRELFSGAPGEKMDMLLNSVAIGFASSAPDPGALRAVLQQVVDQQALAWNASFSLGLVYGGVAESVAVAGGLSDHATGTVVTPSTRYPLGSATKLHTSIACLQAAERGLLDLDAPIAQYVDPFLQRTNGTTLLQLYKNNANISAVTTRQALAMRSGVHDYDDAAVQAWSLDPANKGRDLSPYDYLHADDLTPKAFTFAPGGGGAYSSIGYALAGLALAAVSGAKEWFDLDQRAVVPQPLLKSLPGYQFAGRGACSNPHPNPKPGPDPDPNSDPDPDPNPNPNPNPNPSHSPHPNPNPNQRRGPCSQ